VRAHHDFAERSGDATARYSQAVVDAMLALARGEFEAALSYTGQAGELSRDWGGSIAQEGLMGQAGWLLYETGQTAGLAEFLRGLPKQEVSGVNEEMWELAAGLIHAECAEPDSAIHILNGVCASTGDLTRLPRGPSRMPILATAAAVLGHPAVCDATSLDDAHRIGTSIARLLTDHHDKFALAGWPAVLLGSKHRHIGLAYLAAGQPEKAEQHLNRAVEDNYDFPVLHVRTRFDLARARIQQPASHAEGIAELERVQQKAAELTMPQLAAQAAALRRLG
jgi:tetratricopeptide (TPR) repeat protein